MKRPEENPLEILLFDMDGVLLVPTGYHFALQETVRRVGLALGFAEAGVSKDTIAQFEAAGATSEWDSAAMCTALLLLQLWETSPEGRVTPELLKQPQANHGLPAPDFLAFAAKLAHIGSPEIAPLARAEMILIEEAPNRPGWQTAHLQEILRSAREIDHSITHQMFQELVLGSEMYAEIYAREPALYQAGTLMTHDRPTLNKETYQELQSWLAKPTQCAAIFTNRPTRAPDGQSGTPEGELGQVTTSLQGLPLIGWGQLTWLSKTRYLDEEAFGKPAPGHALAALQCARGVPVEEALHAAADLQLGRGSAGWKAFAGAQIHAFEDGAAGLVSARAAGELLAKHGVSTEVHLFGISQEAPKQLALEKAGGQIFPNLASALYESGIFEDEAHR